MKFVDNYQQRPINPSDNREEKEGVTVNESVRGVEIRDENLLRRLLYVRLGLSPLHDDLPPELGDEIKFFSGV